MSAPEPPAAARAGEPETARDLDLVLLGATGFTGRLTAHHLARQLAGTSTRWAIAGRDRAKLEALRGELPADPAVEVVDAGDLVGLVGLAGRTRALATTVGPFARHGELVVQACVRAGAHYADVTGEPDFVALIARRHHDDAVRRGVAIVSCCGFEAVPADLGVQFTVARLPDDVPVEVRGYLRAAGRFSGGTAETALDAIAARRLPRHPTSGVAAPRRPVSALPRRVHRAAELGGWGVPLPLIDTAVVLRSARELGGYGSAFRYGHYAHVAHLPAAAAGLMGLRAFAAAAAFAPSRWVLRRVLPSPGRGPPPEVRARGRFALTFVATGGRQRVITRVSGGDPGYDATAIMLGEAVRCLAGEPGRAVGATGVVTPAMALGDAYRRRLHAHGVRFEVRHTGGEETTM